MRLIDADKMRENWLENGENEYVYDTNAVLDSIDSQPTVDAVPVVHGRWAKDGTCSNCKELNPTYRANKWSAEFPDFPGNFDHLNYCPNCGAKVDK